MAAARLLAGLVAGIVLIVLAVGAGHAVVVGVIALLGVLLVGSRFHPDVPAHPPDHARTDHPVRDWEDDD